MDRTLSQRVGCIGQRKADNADALDFTQISFGKFGGNHRRKDDSKSLKDCVCKCKAAVRNSKIIRHLDQKFVAECHDRRNDRTGD